MRTQDTLSSLIAELTANCGDIYDACRAVGVSPLFLSRWRKDDVKVNEEIEEACRVGTMRLDSIAVQRVAHGTVEDVYYKGEVVGEKRNFHDGLFQTVLKAKLPQVYGGDEGARTVFNGPVQINNMPRANSYAEWLEMKDATESRRALPPPLVQDNDVIDADFVSINSPQFAGLGL